MHTPDAMAIPPRFSLMEMSLSPGRNNNQVMASSEVYSPTFDSSTVEGHLNVALPRSNATPFCRTARY